MRTLWLWAAILSLLSTTALAQNDCEGCKDHPQVQRFPGFYLAQATTNDFNSISFTVAEGKEVQKEGKYWKLWYGLKEGAKAPSCVETARNYENAFKKGGGKLVWRTSDWCTATLSMPLGTGMDTIKPESEPLLAEVVKLLSDNAGLQLSVEGHTDNQGNPKSNLTLSQKRAESVKKYLTGKGVNAKRLSTKGWGDTKPVADNRTEDGRAQNRRVELVKK